MAAVFEIYNADGTLQIDLAKRLPRFLGSFTISNFSDTGRIDHAGFATGQPFFVNGPMANWIGNQPGYIPKIYAETTYIRWTYLDYDAAYRPAPSARFSVTVTYGVF